MRFLTIVILATCACHVVHRSTETAETSRSLRPLEDTATPHGETVTVTSEGRLRFITPLVCKAEVIVEGDQTEIVRKEPNLATVIVGVIAASLGGVAMFAGLSSDDGDLATAGGALGVAIGAPLVIAPFVGNSTRRRHLGHGRHVKQIRGGEPCGDRPIPADRATLEIGSQRVYGTVDADGTFSVPVFELIDAFDLPRLQALQLRVVIPHDIVPRRLEATLDAETLASGRDGFFRDAGVDAATPALIKVPGLTFDNATAVHDGDAVTIGLSIHNAGPGVAHGVRATIQSRYPYLDGRIVYVGRLDKGASASPSLAVRVPDASLPASTTVTIYVDDADKTAPSYSVSTTVSRPLKGMDDGR